jgi:hypothetical protein
MKTKLISNHNRVSFEQELNEALEMIGNEQPIIDIKFLVSENEWSALIIYNTK